MAFKFGAKPGADKVKQKYSKRDLLESPVLYQDPIVDVTVVVEQAPSQGKLIALQQYLTRKGLRNYQILTPLRFRAVEKDFKTGITQLYLDNSFDLTRYINPGSKVISMGRSIYYLTRSSDLDIESFYDRILWRTYFFDPIRQCRTYVIDSYKKIIGFDNFESKHSGDVIAQCMKEEYEVDKTPRFRKFIDNTEDLKQMFLDNADHESVALDTETTGFDYLPTLEKKMSDRLLSMEFCFDGLTGYHVLWDVIEKNIRLVSREISWREQLYANGKFDGKFLIYNGFRRNSIHIDHDIIQMRHIVNEMSRLGLKPQSFLLTNFGGYDFALDQYKKKNKVKSYGDIPASLLGEYGPDDAIATFRCKDENLKDIQKLDKLFPNPHNEEWTLERLYYEIRMPYLNNYLDMELEGLTTDIKQLDETSNLLKQRIFSKTQELYTALNIPKDMIDLSSLSYEETTDEPEGKKFTFGAVKANDSDDKLNVNSNQQLGKYIEDSLGWIVRERDKEGIAKVNAATVARWIKDGHKNAIVLDELSKLKTLFGTFIGERKGPKGVPSGFYQYLRKHDDGSWRVHPDFSSMLAGSWRCKCRNPNLQNLPARGEKSILVKRQFTPLKEDEMFYSEDFSGLQLRLVAIVTMDPVMLEIFLHGDGDMHSQTAFEVFCRSIYYKVDMTKEGGYSLCGPGDPSGKKMTKESFMMLKGSIPQLKSYRQKSKGINFGFLFSMAAITMAMTFIKVEWSFEDIEKFIEENDLFDNLANNLDSCGDVFYGLQKMYNDHKGIRRQPRGTRFSVSEAVAYLKDNNLFHVLEDRYGYEEVEKLFDAYAITVAEDIRESFFDTYKGLAKYAEDQKKQGRKHGYVRSIYGAFRRLPYLTYKGRDTNGGFFANKEAIAINSPIQNMESVNVARWLDNVKKECAEKGLKSRAFGTIHDASENIVVKTELREYNEINKKWSLHPYPELNGVPLETEANFADYFGTKGTTKIDYDGNEVDGWTLWDQGPEVNEESISAFEESLKAVA